MLERALPESRAGYAHCDVTLKATSSPLFWRWPSRLSGGLDILFNTPDPMGIPGPVEASPDAEGWDKVFALLVRGPVLGINPRPCR